MPHAKKRQLSSPARRHLLAVGAASATKAAAALTVVSGILRPSEARGDHDHDVHCFIEGTRVRTPHGNVRVDDLQIGDLVVTMHGGALPVKWIGRYVYEKSGSSWPKSIMPIRVSRFAIDDNTPHRDLYLSPWHALFIDGFLMPARDLVNGISIAPAVQSGMQRIAYFQIIMETHQVVWAEGAPAETFLANTEDKYELFANFAEYQRLYSSDFHAMTPLAPNLGTGGAHLRALFGIGRDPLQDAYDRIAARAEKLELVA